MPTNQFKFQHFVLLITFVYVGVIGLNIAQAQTPSSAILDVAWSPNGENLASVDADGTLRVSLLNQTSVIFQFERPDQLPSALQRAAAVWSPSGDRLAVGIGNRIYIWRVDTWQLLNEFPVGLPSGLFTFGPIENIPEGVQNITWSLDGRYIVVGTFSYQTSVWDSQENQLVFQQGDYTGGGPGRVWLGNGWLGDGTTKLNYLSGALVSPSAEDFKYRFGGSAEGGTTEPRPDNTQMARGDVAGFLVIHDINTLRGVRGLGVTDSTPPEPKRGIADISWDGTWNFIAVVSRDGELYVVNLVTSEVATVLNIDGQLNTVDWNPRTNEIIYGGVSNTGQPILATVDVGGIAALVTLGGNC
jgi:WD40 repeat protein